MILSFGSFRFLSPTAVPPDVPKIHNEAGVVLPSHAGPYEEGGDLVLICVVTGGMYRLYVCVCVCE